MLATAGVMFWSLPEEIRTTSAVQTDQVILELSKDKMGMIPKLQNKSVTEVERQKTNEVQIPPCLFECLDHFPLDLCICFHIFFIFLFILEIIGF